VTPLRRAMSAQFYSLVVITLIQVAQVPIYIWALGAEKYGGYLLLVAIPSALTLADFGLLSATSTRQIGHVARGELKAAAALSRFTNSILMYIAAVALAGVAVYTAVGPVPQVAGFVSVEARSLLVAYSVYALLFVISSSFEGVYRAAGRHVWAWTRLSSLRLLDFVTGAGVLLATHDIVLTILAMVTTRVVGLAFIAAKVRSVATWASWRPCLPRRHMAPGMLRPTLGSLAQPAANALVNQGATVAVGVILGPVAVVALSSCRTLANMLRQLTGVVNNSALPQLTTDLAEGRRVSAFKDLRRNALFVAAVILPCGAILGVLGPWVISLWTHGAVVDTTVLLWLLVVQVLVESAWLVLSMWYLAQNRHLGYSVVYLVSAMAFVGAILLFSPRTLEWVVVVQIIAAASVLVYLIIRLLSKENGKPNVANISS
jgi:O-antigen/teichoic acid export membrane protein